MEGFKMRNLTKNIFFVRCLAEVRGTPIVPDTVFYI